MFDSVEIKTKIQLSHSQPFSPDNKNEEVKVIIISTGCVHQLEESNGGAEKGGAIRRPPERNWKRPCPQKPHFSKQFPQK